VFEKDVVLDLLGGADGDLSEAHQTLDGIRKGDDGAVADLRMKRRAVRKALDRCEDRLRDMRKLVAAFTEPAPVEEPDPPPSEPEDPPPSDTEVPTENGERTDDTEDLETRTETNTDRETFPPAEPPVTDTGVDTEPPPAEPTDLIDLADQHAVSKLMQDSAVHLAVKRTRNFWEIRHRNTADGRPSAPIRAQTIGAAYEIYDREAIRQSSFQPFEPRPLSLEEQQALLDLQAIGRDNARSVRWEATKTEVDYIDSAGRPAGGAHDDVEFEPGELVRPIAHLKRVLG